MRRTCQSVETNYSRGMSDKKWDVFICHASEDKDFFVRPLAVSLNQLGVEVWYDEFSLRLGDSLSRSIDHGLANSHFGIVVISANFIGKAWPERELGGLVSREIDQGRVIIPIWHGVTRKQVLDFSPTLADKLAVRPENLTPQDIAIQILREIRPDLYEKHPRSELERLASGEAIKDIQRELEEAKDALLKFKCPFCGAPLSERLSVSTNAIAYGIRQIFACGYESFDSEIETPCPSDPQFPRFEDYELEYRHLPMETRSPWECYAFAKTEMARKRPFHVALGRTKEEAEQKLMEEYKRCATKYSA
jgi:hypothetical protein